MSANLGYNQRAFAQKISRQHAADVRRQVSSVSSFNSETTRSVSFTSSINSIHSFQTADTLEPVDYEDFVQQHSSLTERDPLKPLLSFPADDVEILYVPRRIRTLHLVLPPEPLDQLDARTRASVKCTTANWLVLQRRYQQYSLPPPASQLKNNILRTIPRQEFDMDGEEDEEGNADMDATLVPQSSSTRESRRSTLSAQSNASLAETPRGSWASFDLRQSVGDPLLPSLLDRLPQDTVDANNRAHRLEVKQEAIFALYPMQEDEELIERRAPAEMPAEHEGHLLLVKCTQLQLDLEVEPMFASMALYDAKEKKKISENFYFDLNPEGLKKMLTSHVPYQDISTMSRAAIFDVSFPSTDLFLVVKLEKVLQGDISECAEPYIKEDKHREKIKSLAVLACERLGHYRMPFAWTGIHLHSILNGSNSLDRDSTDLLLSGHGNSLDRKSAVSFESKRKEGAGSLTRRGSLERRSGADKRHSWSSDDVASSLDSFRPVTLTVSSFFKQEGERLRDEDLFKYLQELKRSNTALRRLKCIPGTLKLEVSPCPEEVKFCLTSELAKLHPYPEETVRPTKELVEFPVREIYVPHYNHRNLLFVYPKNLNFANRPGSARNIAVKVQFKCGEEESDALPVIFGKSSCPEFTTEAFTTVTYHNKSPDFYDEMKVKLPAPLRDVHHLLFTFYHISCQKKTEQAPIETIVGYSWLPLVKDGSLQHGEFCLPVLMDNLHPRYFYISPHVPIPGTRWVDNHKDIFTVVLKPTSSVHTQDPHLERFLRNVATLEDCASLTAGVESTKEIELRDSIVSLKKASLEPLVKFLPLVMDKLLTLLMNPPMWNGESLTVGGDCFGALAMLVSTISRDLEEKNDQHGRNSLLVTYVHCQMSCCSMQTPSSTPTTPSGRPLSMPPQRRHNRSTSQPDIAQADNDLEVQGLFARGIDRAASMRTGADISNPGVNLRRKLLHEEIALHWGMCGPHNPATKEVVLSNAWFFFEVMVKSMVEHLAAHNQLDAPRKHRFPERLLDDVIRIINVVTTEILNHAAREGKDSKFANLLNAHLAFFYYDILSVMDRGFVFSLIKSYIRQLSEDRADVAHLTSLRLDFMRIVCSHEHFVALNLPFSTPFTPSSAPASPTLSVASSNSQSSFVSTLIGSSSHRVSQYAELSAEFRQHHFLVGLLLSELAAVLEMPDPTLHSKAINSLRNLLTCHDWDARYADWQCKARVATLYLPLIGIVLDALSQLYDWKPEARGRDRQQDDGDYSTAQAINPNVAMAIAGRGGNSQVYSHRKMPLNAECTRHLLLCIVWILRHVDESALRCYWSELPAHRLQLLLELLFSAVSCFEYKGKRYLKRLLQQSLSRHTDLKSRLEDVILGQGSARHEMMRRRERNPSPSAGLPLGSNNQPHTPNFPGMGHGGSSSSVPGSTERPALRWRKDLTCWRSPLEPERPRVRDMELEADAHIEGNLATQANLAVMDSLELLVQVVSQQDNLQGLLPGVLRVILHMLACTQSTALLQNLFATQRSFVFKYPSLLFDEETELCADLCLRLLRHCSSAIAAVRSQASASLYSLMRQNFEIGNNFARVKMQVTMSLSSLVGTSSSFNEEALRKSLKTILIYSEEDSELQDTSFPEQVRDLIFNLHMILSDTVKMKEFEEDPEMLLDLMYRIAKGYQNSPDLRLTWLASMAQKHIERGNHAEAALCLVHSAALVSEYLRMLEDRMYLPAGAVTFQRLSPNALEESAVSDDVVSPDEEGICTGKYFTENGLVGLLEQAASAFYTGGLFEAMNEVYKILTPIAEAHRDYKKLINIHSKLHDAFTRIEQTQGKRVFGTYFRVGFYGSKFGDLDGEEFVYKEPTLTKLAEISHRLENFYCDRFGVESVVMIKDSNPVDSNKLHPEKAYIQITYVEPYFDSYELRERFTIFERNYNIKRFMYATPFTPDGRAHGELHEQYKRKTILTTLNHFPYVKTRIQVMEKKQLVLTPIEVATEDIQKKTQELAVATMQEPPDPKILQMVLQGCIGTTVNQGPMEIAHVFLLDLSEGKKQPTKLQTRLRLCFKDFSKKCLDALERNRKLVGPDQVAYQKELENNYRQLKSRLAPLLATIKRSRSQNAADVTPN